MNREAVALGTPGLDDLPGPPRRRRRAAHRRGAAAHARARRGRRARQARARGARRASASAATRPCSRSCWRAAPRRALSAERACGPDRRLAPYNPQRCADGSVRRRSLCTAIPSPRSRSTGHWSRSRTGWPTGCASTAPRACRGATRSSSTTRSSRSSSARSSSSRSSACTGSGGATSPSATTPRSSRPSSSPRWRCSSTRRSPSRSRARHGFETTVTAPSGVLALHLLLMLTFVGGARFVARTVYERPLRGFRAEQGRARPADRRRRRRRPARPARDPAQPGARPQAGRLRRRRPAQAPAADRRRARARHDDRARPDPRRGRARRGDDRDPLRARRAARERRALLSRARHPRPHAADGLRAAAERRRDRRAPGARRADRGHPRPRAGAHGARPRRRLPELGDRARHGRGRLDRQGALAPDRARRARAG